jgi:predicted NACHT family NTPase
LPEKLSDYLNLVIISFKKWQVFFVHILGRQVAEINLLAREVNAMKDTREGTVEELRYLISQNEKIMMILGQPGMGKSTSMQYLVQKDAQKLLQNNCMPNLENRVPIYLELRLVTDSIFDLILKEISPYCVAQNAKLVIDKMLERGLFSIFLDGLNETVKDKSDNILKEIQIFYKKYPNCMYIISSRPEEYKRRPISQIPIFNLEAMNKEQQKEFLTKNTSEVVEKIITDTLFNFPDLESFLGVPLLLFMLIRVVEQTNQVPKNKNQIIKTFLEGIYALEEKKNSNFDKYQIDILLADLAKQYFDIHQQGNAKLPYPKITEYLSAKIRAEKFNLNTFDVLKKMVELQILDFSQEKYAFKHQLFLDYFVLKYDIDFEF